MSLRRLIHHESAGGVLLVVVALLALGLANSPLASVYRAMWTGPAKFVVNDILMAVFFFSIGLEIRREIAHGSLRTIRTSALPVCAALGGMIVPAIIYLSIATVEPHGWGVPMATDIAFAIGILGLLGRRVPSPLRVYLLALAVIDDLGAIVVIAIFYSSGVDVAGIAIALASMLLVVALQRMRVTSLVVYLIPAVGVWTGVYLAGIHPTIAGVVLGLMTPVDVAEKLEHRLAPWVNVAIMPIFAFANAGVTIGGVSTTDLPVALGVALGLLLGKPIGVVGASALAVRLRVATLPSGVTWRGVVLVGIVASIGFTMALFVAELAFPGAPAAHDVAKLAVISASAVGAIVTLVVGRSLFRA